MLRRKLIGILTGLIAVVLLGAVWWGVVEAANTAQPSQVPTPPAPFRQGMSEPGAPDISFIDSPSAQCYLPERHTDSCYIQWQYLYVTASTSQYIISMTVNIDSRMRAYYSGFFQTSMYIPQDMTSPGFRVRCGTPGSGGNPNLGMSYSFTIRARETGGLGAANYGSVYCPFDVVPPANISLTGPTDGLPNVPYSFTAFIDPVTTTLPLTYTWSVSDQAIITTTHGISDAQTYTWNTTGPKQIVVRAWNIVGSASVTQTFNISNAASTPTPTGTPPTPTPTGTITPEGGYHEHLPLIINGGLRSSAGDSTTGQ